MQSNITHEYYILSKEKHTFLLDYMRKWIYRLDENESVFFLSEIVNQF